MRTYIASIINGPHGEYVKIRARSDEDALRLARRYADYRNHEGWGRKWCVGVLRRVPVDTSTFQGKSRSHVFDLSSTIYDSSTVVFRPVRKSDRRATRI